MWLSVCVVEEEKKGVWKERAVDDYSPRELGRRGSGCHDDRLLLRLRNKIDDVAFISR
jgi:hypothetical protein